MHRLDRTYRFFLVALIVALSANVPLRGQRPDHTRPTWRVADAPPELKPVIARADLIVVEMHDALIRELTAALERGGPEFALRSCHIDVVGLLHRLGRQEGITAGRTGDRLRNPANAPPAWAAPVVRTHSGRMARDLDGFAVDLGDKVGLLRPIVERPMCALCHGPAASLSPEVRHALAARYPADRAIDFKEGEVRGWYWVEMPKGR
jgi:hypothetical protein